MGATKRRRAEVISPGAKRAKIVDPSAVRWKEVALPDRLDNYEGFFGLEEVDDVEVIWGDAGKVSFVSKGKSDSLAETDQSEDEWAGFSDSERPPAPGIPTVQSEKKRKQVQARALEKRPSVFSALTDDTEEHGADVSAWQSLNLSPDTLASLSRLGFAEPTPIQQAAIPEVLAGHDVVGKASTGSGKTLAFGIPILERFLIMPDTKRRNDKAPLALILSPTRELAHQLTKHLKALCSTGLQDEPRVATLTGGSSILKQQRMLRDADVVIGTPGRLWEVMSSIQGTISALRQIKFLVVDEADRLLSEGHFEEVEEIINALDRTTGTNYDDNDDGDGAPQRESLPKRLDRQTLVFSATFDKGLQRRLTGRGKGKAAEEPMTSKESMEYLLKKLNFQSVARGGKPKFLDVNPVQQMATRLEEGLIECTGMEKDLYLYTLLLLLRQRERTLVFTNSIDAVRRIAPFLQNLGLTASALHSGMVQKARLRAIERFSADDAGGRQSILVATDVAARGLDLPNVQLVVHYHLPRTADVYVHRSGRTARAGRSGRSILICGPEEVAGVRKLVAKVHAQAADKDYHIRTLDIDRRIVTRLKPRTTLAKKLADASIAKAKQHKSNDFFKQAAEELGVNYDSEELEKTDSGKRGRGGGRKKKEREARGMTKEETGAMRAELKALLKERVNAGVSERYLASGNVDVDELIRQQQAGGKTGDFLGSVSHVGLEEYVAS